MKSDKIKILYHLHNLDEAERLREIHIDFISRIKFNYLFSKNVSISKEDSTVNLLPHRIIPKLFLKYFANKIFFLLKAKVKNDKIIKSWVEVTEKIYKDELHDSQILIYPFPIKIYRQLKYIFNKIKKSESVGLMGVPYKISPLLKTLFNRNIDYLITVFEYTGAIRHANYFLKYQGIQKILTTEEFEVASFSFSKKLIKSGVQVINACHGLSVYSPFVYYSKFLLINKKQKELYSIFNKNLDFEIIYDETFESKVSKVSKIIFVDQGDLGKLGMPYEAALRGKVLGVLNQIGKKRNSTIQIKTHPNTKQKEIKRLQSQYEYLPIIKKLKPPLEGLVFITLYSTAYYDFRKYGSFLFIKDDLFNPSLFFGPKIKSVHVSELKVKIEDLIKNGE
ncbi:MAG: hypothetical protein KJO41_03515 [Bacteroidia bacterium]|nr:hypothetical protein [Bacteroidia bacterium]